MAISKLNKTFVAELILTAQEMNQIVDKIDEIIEVKPDSIEVENSASTTLELQPNKYYVFSEVAALTLTLATGEADKLAEYMFEFTSGTTPTTLSLPDSVKWIGDNTIEASKKYLVSIVNNVAVIGGVA